MEFKKIKGASTAPIGYAWHNNGKSRFKPGYKSKLVKEEMKDFKDFGEEHTREQWVEMIKAIDSGEKIAISEWIYYYFL